ncbi:galactoside alpha-(1,2)-fucosyltransferase 2-like [Haliotis cracherodii]|uniref:galactoside alpha-(1,2)-fucosyltransferase 2-like n=1 Tax=Haliotis cracherodii TaxID=6455 RepID=UPI0039EB4568
MDSGRQSRMTTNHGSQKYLSTRNVLSLIVLCAFTVLVTYQWRHEVQVYHMFINGSLSSLTFAPARPATLSRNQNATASTVVTTRTNLATFPTRNNATTTSPQTVFTTSQTVSSVCRNPFREEYLRKQDYLCSRPLGRFGNLMFIYASSYGIATYNNRTLIMGKALMLTDYFNLNVLLVDDFECVVTGTKGVGPRQACAFDERLMHIAIGENVCIGNYLQSYKYFEHVQEAIKKQFTFKKEIRDKAMGIIDGAINTFHKRNTTLKDTRLVLVGVHVRRGDMVKNKFGYAVATPEYLANATQYYRDKFPNRLFIVCSNGMAWTKQHVVGDDVFYVEGNTFEVDMAVLVSCNHSLTTVGSFSWWAGFLAGGQVVYYQWPAIEKSGIRRHFSANYTDFFPPSWIGM